ncbi:MAG: ATP-binding cassette domain-containing protein [Clostridium baratii]|uniref:ABC transporter ATP-binding protein n=1 Tax=Clostridium baratii TaxID=1561 RepID=UPI0024308B8F|nr:ATP-binding cassette domain-containing protein [Clostridium baratii]MBS6006546.1 ATP-binding cassette domain-containing protein [Clostridium baratii]MDU1053786.1 ATP-binding cassette domain-containing protein [Clostridium baratii]
MKDYKNALEVNNITKNYKGFSLDNVTFNLKKGFIMGLVGPNGAGKTTTIKAIMNLINLNSGSIKIFEEDLKKNEIEIKDRIGFVYDECSSFEDFSIEYNKKIVAPFYSKWNENKFNEYLKMFKLDKKKKVKDLSKGQKMRFSLAIALSHEAELLILDEPTSGLDPVFRSELLDLFFDLIKDGELSILYSTHITTDLEKLADYITFIKDGKVEFSKEKDILLEEYSIIKGSVDDITEEIRKELIGERASRYNFEALIKNKNDFIKKHGSNFVFERASIDDIIVFYSKKGKVLI